MSDDQVPANFLEKVYRLNQVAVKQRQQVVEGKLQDQEAGRRLMAEYAPEACLKVLNLLRITNDPATILKCAKFITDRAWGTPKPMTEEEKKGADGGSILDVLAAASVHNRNLEITIKQNSKIESELKDITPDHGQITDLEGFFEEVDKESGDD